MHYKFFWPDNRVRDGQNFQKAILDRLVNEDVLMDDNWTVVSSESWDHGGVDKKYPRVELTITVKGK